MKLDFCVACGTKENIQHHHLKPASKGGSDEEFNLITLCIQCHAIIHGRDKAFTHSSLTKAAMGIKKASGQLVGSVPFGYDLDSNGVDLIANESELEAIAMMRELRKRRYSLARIALKLESMGIKTKKGKTKWQPMTILNLLNNPLAIQPKTR